MSHDIETNNLVQLRGTLFAPLQKSHCVFHETFYECKMRVCRLSDAEDILPVTVSERLLEQSVPETGESLLITGQLRSYNKYIDGANRLILTVFARELTALETEPDEHVNEITLSGYLCKPAIYRTTPFGREIADLLLAVNRSFNKSDYIPCIAWGRNARYCQSLDVGQKIMVSGRVQSREYVKMLSESDSITRTAYEVSVTTLEILEEP